MAYGAITEKIRLIVLSAVCPSGYNKIAPRGVDWDLTNADARMYTNV